MIIFQTVILQIRTQIVDLPTARAMWEYLEHRHYSSSQAELYTLYHSLSGLQQGEDIMDQFYNNTVHYGIILMLSNLHTTLIIHATQILTCSKSCSHHHRYDETRHMYEFMMCLHPEFELTQT